jgi:molecular chaperone GrpE (heat shock protein)
VLCLIKFLYDLIVNNDIIANTFRRESDNSEVAYDNDLHTIAKSGDYNDLINPPSDYSMVDHGNEWHTEDFETTSNATTKANTAETNAKDYADSTKADLIAQIESLQTQLQAAQDKVDGLDREHSAGQELLMDLWIENELSSQMGSLDSGYWYVNNQDTAETFLTENRMDARIDAVYDRTNNLKIYEIEEDQRFDDYPYYPTQD